MTLSEVYFYMIIFICIGLTFFVIFTSEDLKDEKRYNWYRKYFLFIGFGGVTMELLGWNYLCPINCALLTFSPFLTVNIIKATTIIFRKLFDKEPYQTYRHELSDGIWVDNKGDLKHKNYYIIYSVFLNFLPVATVLLAYSLIRNHFC
ncbi:hypothetical protein [Mangrovimonas sp. ST2L15]|uniref:hypothetical protein n=1 Tax=Mangrovimonas sp. ST2L15 TaxID=1645916 RepID=UPI0006B47E4E|nr:hypothetical protein [Mangrovimonas sp. ST2L15]